MDDVHLFVSQGQILFTMLNNIFDHEGSCMANLEAHAV
jgi:hypothetical protein